MSNLLEKKILKNYPVNVLQCRFIIKGYATEITKKGLILKKKKKLFKFLYGGEHVRRNIGNAENCQHKF